MVWYSHLLKNFPQFIVIHTVKGFGIVNKAEIDVPQFIVIHTVKGFGIVNEGEIDVFLELFCFLDDPADVGNSISGSSPYYVQHTVNKTIC